LKIARPGRWAGCVGYLPAGPTKTRYRTRVGETVGNLPTRRHLSNRQTKAGGILYIARLAVGLGRARLAGLGWRGWQFHIVFPALGYLLLAMAWLQPVFSFEYFAASEVVLLLV